MAQTPENKSFQITQNHIWIILIGVCGWYFSSQMQSNATTEQQQFQLTLTVEKLTGIVERLQSDVAFLSDELRNRTANRYSRADHELYADGVSSQFDVRDKQIQNIGEDIRKIQKRLEALENSKDQIR